MCHNALVPFSRVKRVVFLALLVVAKMVLGTLQIEEISRYEHYSHQYLAGFFEHQLKMEIKTDR